jgi:hypothetical protein
MGQIPTQNSNIIPIEMTAWPWIPSYNSFTSAGKFYRSTSLQTQLNKNFSYRCRVGFF